MGMAMTVRVCPSAYFSPKTVSRNFSQHKRYATEIQAKVVTCNFLQQMLLLAVYFTTLSVSQTNQRREAHSKEQLTRVCTH
jgi:hypothetical protein